DCATTKQSEDFSMLPKREPITPLSREQTKVARPRRVVRLLVCARAHTTRLGHGFGRVANQVVVKSKGTAAEQALVVTGNPRLGHVHPRAQPNDNPQSATPTTSREHAKNFGVRSPKEPCPAAEDDESAARYLYE